MNKWLSPSNIHFLKMHSHLIVGDTTYDDTTVDELSRKLATEEMSIKVPKMQVSEKDGKMFALNNSLLHLMRQLEKQGKLQQGLIQVEVVPLTKVPSNIQMRMVVDQQEYSKMSSKEVVCDELNSIKINENKCLSEEGSSRIDINGLADDESDREEDDEEEDEEVDENEEQSSGSSTSDETMQCNVCDRTFPSAKLLAKHQLKKKHFGCSVCDTLFPSLRALEEHKETLEHWSDDENPLTENDNSGHNTIIKPQREELERLL